jgi:hypothetical protein
MDIMEHSAMVNAREMLLAYLKQVNVHLSSIERYQAAINRKLSTIEACSFVGVFCLLYIVYRISP